MSTITIFELQFGVENSQQQKKSQQALDHFLEPFLHILPVDKQVVIVAAKARSTLKKKGKPIGPYDVLIDAVALSNDLTLVTNNIREFQRMKGLKIENWASSK